MGMDTWIHKLYQDCAADLFRIARHRLQDEHLAQDIIPPLVGTEKGVEAPPKP